MFDGVLNTTLHLDYDFINWFLSIFDCDILRVSAHVKIS